MWAAMNLVIYSSAHTLITSLGISRGNPFTRKVLYSTLSLATAGLDFDFLNMPRRDKQLKQLEICLKG